MFERSPGTCPFTNQDLVPVTSTEGHAETALGLTGANDGHVDLGDPAALRFGGKAYSIEAWVKPAAYDRPVLSRGGEYRLGLDAGGSLRLAHEGAATAVVSAETVPKDVYTHIAATFDGTTAKLYVNGKLSGSGALPFTPATGVNTLMGKQVSGTTAELFAGDLDEVRVWSRVRSATELADDLNHRLVGNEAGLVAYYRFDEGSGATAYDQSDRALHGTLKGDAKWTGSDAPVGDHPGVRRDSFVLKGRTVESGMSAVIYHQQENVSAGYRPDPKPAKRQARVMLAFAAKYGQEPALVSLDFAVGRDGRLAQVPDVLDPEVLRRPVKGHDSEQVSALQQLIRQLEPEVAALPTEIARLSATAGQVAYWQGDHDRLLPGFERLERQYLAEKDVPTAWNYALELKTPREVDGQVLRYFNAPIHTSVLVVLSSFRLGGWRLEDTGESQNGKPYYWLVGNNPNNLDLHVLKNSSAQNTMLDTIVREPGNPFAQFQLTAEGEYTRIVNRGSKLALGLPASFPTPTPVQSSECLTGDSGLIRMVRVSLRSGVDTAYLQAKQEMDTVRERLQEARTAVKRVNELQLRLTGKQAELKDAQEKLARLSTALQGDDDLTVAMPLISVDTTGLSLSGGLLEFARGTDRPALLDSGTGAVVLYFRGANEQFFAVYYDTAVTRGTQRLTGNGGTLGFLARDPGVLLDNAVIKVSDGDAPGRCDLTITVGGDTETWRSLPRKAEQMAAALAGQSGQAVTVGTVAQVTGTTVEFTAAITVAVAAKAHLQIGANGYAASAEAPVGAKTLNLTAAGTAIKPGDTVTVVGYDWARAESTRVGVLLSAGSRLITLNSGGATSVPNGTAIPVTGGRGCRWRAEMPGRAFLFDGKDQYLTLPAAQQKNAAPAGDLTLEAWVNPEAGGGRIVHARTDGSGYSLALTPAALPAWQFVNGTKAQLTPSLDLANRDFTIELWAKRNQSRGRVEPLLFHGATDGRVDQSLHLWFHPDETFYFSLYGDDLKTTRAYPDLEWHHWAAVYRNATREQILYRDGVEVARRTATGTYTGNGPLILGHFPFTGDYLDGQIDEVRVFGRARTAQEISSERNQRLSGREPGLLGHWTFNEPNGPASPIKGYQVVARVGDRLLRSADRFPCNEWAHLAAAFTQAWALRLDGGEGLSVASQDSLNVLEDLTIEVFVQVDKVGAPMALVTKGSAVGGGREGVPYQLGVLADGRVEFAFAEADGKPVRYVSERAVKPGAFQRISVVRQRRKAEVSAATSTQAATAGQPEQEIRFYLDGALAGTYVYGGPGAQSNSSDLEIGRGLRGILCEVRLWSSARTFQQLGQAVAVREKGLLARWAFEENAGNATLDASGSFPAKLRGARWTRDVDPAASPLRLYRNGEPLLATTAPTPADLLPYGDPQLTLGARLEGGKPTELLTGTLEEVRIWRTVRTREQILDNLFTRLRGNKQDLLGYWTFDRDSTAATTSVRDEGLRGNNLAFSTKRPRILLSTAPVSTDTAQVRSALADVRTPFHDTVSGAPAASEYADLQFGAKGETLGVLKRCYGFVRDGRWHLVTGYKVGDLTTEWVGQAQFDPQLMGYIEGAPPVPSENLTGKPDGFLAASSVEFTEADQVVHSLSASKTRSTNTAFNVSFGLETVADVMTVAAPLGFGTASPLAEGQLKMAVTAGLEFSNTWSEDTTVSQGKNTARKTKLELTGYTEDAANVLNSDLGPRYVPANTGMALVQSQTADVFALRLAHTGALVAYRMLPNPDIPLDWNIVHFPINPRYTKQGTLDGGVGFDAFGKVTDPDYPTATTYGEYSYFKPRDAYALKRRITRDQQRLQAFYQSISTDVGHNSGTEPAETQAKAVLRSMGMSAEQQESARTATGSAAATGFSH
ncbi:LamG domain-containing protein [Streptomyces sp. NPDC005899]|uniref:LamG domain-containing protein n=1 Tax=Streptomyces sp. NPDC005899 TaxID=3155716 RepID=UPI0033DE5785